MGENKLGKSLSFIKPVPVVEELLKISTANTKALLKLELEIKKGELNEKWHTISLEKIFIENRIYRDIEEAESFEEVIKIIDKGLKKYVRTPKDKGKKADKRLKLNREITEDDIIRLTEIRIKKISKYNKFKTDETLANIEEELKQVIFDLKHLTEFAIAYFENLLAKYGKGKERRTEITEFDTIKAVRVVAKNAKLYVDRKEGFVGYGIKKEEFVIDCSKIDDIIAFTKAGIMKVVRNGDKVFIGKNILHTDVWKKGDDRTTYNMIYVDAKTGRAMAKRFNVKSITRDKDYDLTTGVKGNKVLYFAAHPNGETERVQIQLTPGCKAKKKLFEFDFVELEIKGRGSKGNIVTKYPVRKVTQLEIGSSSLGAQELWIDEVSGRLNKEGRGKELGAFDTGDKVIAIYENGTYQVSDMDFNKKFDPDALMDIGKLNDETVVSAVYFDGEKKWTMVKRFQIETKTEGVFTKFITEHKSSKLNFATITPDPDIEFSYKKGKEKHEEELNLSEFIDVKGWKALGNKLGEFKILKISEIAYEEVEETEETAEKKSDSSKSKKKGKDALEPGDTIEFDF